MLLLGCGGLASCSEVEAALASRYSISREDIARMVGRYGDLVEEVLAPTLTDASLAQPVPGAPQHLMAEVRYAATHEGALHLDDLLARRTRISVDTVHRGVESAPAVAALVAPLLGWSAEREQQEVAAYLQRVERERASQALPTDDVAQSVRSQAPDSRPMAADRR